MNLNRRQCVSIDPSYSEVGATFLPFPAHRARRQITRQIILLGFAVSVFVFLPAIEVWRWEDASFKYMITAQILVSVLGAIFYKKLAGATIGVVLRENSFSYPLFYFWEKEFLYKDIFSVEKMNGNLEAIIIAKYDGGGVFIFEKEFEESSDYLFLRKTIADVASRNSLTSEKSKIVEVIDNRAKIQIIQVFYIALLSLVFWLLKYLIDTDFETVLELGALAKNVREGSEVYRLFSTIFLHSGAIHLLSNVLVFTLMAEALLRVQDAFRFFTILLISSLLASLVSLYISPYEYVVGSSGGIFGLFGAYCILKFRKYLPGTVNMRSNVTVVTIILLEVITEYFVDGIDSYSHVGGFLAGALCMGFYLHFAKAQSIFKSTAFEKIVAVLLSGAYLWGLVTFLTKVYA